MKWKQLSCRVGTFFLVPAMIARAGMTIVGAKKTAPTLRDCGSDREHECEAEPFYRPPLGR